MRHLKRSSKPNVRRLWLCLAILICHQAQASDQVRTMVEVDTLVDSDTLFEAPEPLMGKKIGVNGGVLCLGHNHCALVNPLTPTVFLNFDVHGIRPADKLRLTRECRRIICLELLVGELTTKGFVAYNSYATKLPLPVHTQLPRSFPMWLPNKPGVLNNNRT